MGILSLLKGQGLKRSWSLKTKNSDTVVWKLLISPNGILVGEERDVTNKTASMFALDVSSGKILWRGVTVGEAWWFGTEYAGSEVLYVQNFRKPDMPDPKGVMALDIATGKTLWNKEDQVFLFEHEIDVYTMREIFGVREFLRVNKLTGEELESFGRDEEHIRHVKLTIPDVEDVHSIFSTPLGEESELFGPVEELLKSTIGAKEIRGTIDYAEFGNALIFSYHERVQSGAQAMLENILTNELRVLDREKSEIVYSDTLNAQTPFPVPENFFINRGVLIYVREKRELVGVALD